MEEKTYLFQPELKWKNQGFFMTDENENVIYQALAICEKPKFEICHDLKFINKYTNEEVDHKIDGVYGSSVGFGGNKLAASVAYNGCEKFEHFATHSGFEFDGEEIWEYLIKKGVQIDLHDSLSKLGKFSFLSGECTNDYDIYVNGEKIAKIIQRPPKKAGIRYYANLYEIITSKMEEYANILFLIALTLELTNTMFFQSPIND